MPRLLNDRPQLVAGALILAAALALRLPDLGNPQLDLDEQMYLLVGDRMWRGAIPYVDIWDRKPIGLFLLYALARWPGGDPYVGYQLLALAFAAATALTVARLARVLSDSLAAGVAAALVYLVWVSLAGGRGGQSPVLYNLPMALAALALLRGGRAPGMAAMLLVGVAIQIKPTAVFEGCWFGAVLLSRRSKFDASPLAAARYGAALAASAAAPTLLAFAAYAAMGHGRDWWFANAVSIFLREVAPGEPIAERLASIGLAFAPPLLAAVSGVTTLVRPARVVMGGWLFTALAAFLAIPPYYNHYALPVVLPMSVLAGLGAARWWPLGSALAGTAAALLALAGLPAVGTAAAQRARLAAMARVIERHRGAGDLYLFQAEPVFYVETGSRLPTRFPFSPHLTERSEARATGIDPVREVAHVFAGAPNVVVTIAPDPAKGGSFVVAARALARDYHPVGGDMGYIVYARRRVSRPAGAASPPA